MSEHLGGPPNRRHQLQLCRWYLFLSCRCLQYLRGKIETGAVDQSDESFLDDDKFAEAFALLCVSYALADCMISANVEEML